MYENKKIILFGASDVSGSRFEYVLNWVIDKGYEVEYFVDNDINRQGKIINNNKIYSPTKLIEDNLKNCIIIITSGYVKEIKLQLKKMGLKEGEEFISIYDWKELRDSYIHNEILKNIVKNEEGLYLPKRINLEISSFCNMECCYCPYHSKWLPHNEKTANVFMDEECFNLIKNELSKMEYLDSITFGGKGETLIHSKWFEYAETIQKETSIKNFEILTNGKLLNKENIEKLQKLKFENIYVTVSIDGYSAEENSNFRINSDYEVIRGNVKNLLEISKKNSAIKVSIMNVKVPSAESYYTESELEIADYIKKDFDGLQYWGSYAISFNEVMDREFIKRGFLIENGFNTNLFVCKIPFNEIAFNAKGELLSCSCGNGQKNIIGKFKNESLLKLWNNDEFNKMRQMFLNHKNPSVCKACPNNIELKSYNIICRKK
ncbi:hypothetical protein CNEO3_50129 [Clostridium neonatale]|uniref:radical SAM protein n=1 Tax=Clostridium TaxID=1485 RepID=UPI002912B4B2|nr:radical SAM protein [Clostridium sp.]MDU4476653.1 radical SAM protein [Clostridium sp.]CAI3671767.1 hypothetical protein CNEO3_50129 [Clostridium neonatale]